MIRVNIVGQKEPFEIEKGSSLFDLSDKLHLKDPAQAVGAEVNGKNVDLSHVLEDGDHVTFWNFTDAKGKEVFWHTSAHVLAQAVLRHYPDAQPTIGPPIENGFYYDFANLKISDEDLPKIEAEMEAICKENYTSQRYQYANRAEALAAFQHNPYKCALIESFPENEPLTYYTQGEFLDLCRGPHLIKLGKIKALKLLKTSGAYWRGDSKNEMLTRIYGITFPERKMLKEHLTFLEEAKKRDHKVLGPKLDLFSLKEEAPGMPFIHPKGMVIWNKLLDYWRCCHQRYGYLEIKTPTMMTRELWERSGHWANYRSNMFTSHIEERDFAIKPMNCPGAILFYKSHCHSYRELPLKVAEVGHVHRYEASGALSGLFRVRSFHQDDAHLFIKPSDIAGEITKILQLTDEMYKTFGLSYHLELSTRPESNTIGSDEDWEIATNGLKDALIANKRDFRINEGDGAFYGPKIDIHIRDALKRTWQCGTIQLDMALPEKFEMEYTADDGSKKRPIMLHRVIFGSIERFFGILIEHYAGRFPLWLSAHQVRILTVADRHQERAEAVKAIIEQAGFTVDVDASSESISKKVRNAQISQINYMLTIGDQELESQKVSLRTRDNVVVGPVDIALFLEKLQEENQEKREHSSFKA
ncbi:MAG: thrS [Chlamydiales bacterium]|jgi:threonyl-tRNA synthetase|nr:thrS [Chlamydiales bacterium]